MKKNPKILVTGLPGSGKSYVSSFFSGSVELDDYGHHINGEWIVKDLPLNKNIYSGTCSNLDDVIRYIKPDLILFVEASPDFLRKTNKAKLRDIVKNAETAATVDYFTEMCSRTNKAWTASINRERKALEKFAPVWVIFNPGSKIVKHGWH